MRKYQIVAAAKSSYLPTQSESYLDFLVANIHGIGLPLP
jgi:hypothetical protein